MARISRRTILKGTGGMAAILATGRAPAFAQEATVHWLRWNDFIPASDEVLRKQIVPEGKKALAKLRALSKSLDDEFFGPLDAAERDELHRLLLKLAERHEPRCAPMGLPEAASK